jgi:GH24 family phage-related lysozyme (muramidase)
METTMPMTLSADGIKFLIAREGNVSSMYNDNAGHCTVGVGHLIHKGNCDYPTLNSKVNFSDDAPFLPDLDIKATTHLTVERPFFKRITSTEVQELLKKDVKKFEKAVNDNVKVSLNQNQFDALVSFCFNVGIGSFKDSTLLKRLNQRKYNEIPGEMKRWVKSEGKINNGLVNRRKFEADLFSKRPIGVR